MIGSKPAVYSGKGPSPFSQCVFRQFRATTGLIGFSSMLIGVFLLPLRYFWLAYCRAPAASWAEFVALAGVGTIVLYAVAGLTGSWLFNSRLPPGDPAPIR